MYIKEQLMKIHVLIDYFETTDEIDNELLEQKLRELEDCIGENPVYVEYKSISLFNEALVYDAKKCIDDCLKKHILNYGLYTLKYELLKFSQAHEEVYYTLAQMFKLSRVMQCEEQVTELIQEYSRSSNLSKSKISVYYEMINKEAGVSDFRSFPINEFGESVIRKDAFQGRDSGNHYLVNMYKSIHFNNVDNSSRLLFLYETVKGNFFKNKAKIKINSGEIFALSSAKKESSVSHVEINNLADSTTSFKLEPNVIRYFKANNSTEIQIKSNERIFVSHFEKHHIENKPRLVLQIFVDGLSQDFLDKNSFIDLMPNTSSFFKKGYINQNCHANGEWTLPSLMSMSTGKYTTNHYVFHTESPHKGEENNKFVQEYFREAGYMTGRICSNWRGTPSYGYFKGTMRNVYSPMFDRMDVSEVIRETMEHLEVFKNYHNHLWITIEDLHAVADGITRGAFQDTMIEQNYSENVKEDSEISVFRNYNIKKIEEYKAAIKKVDFYLGILFDYIEERYSEQEYIILINSDHGQRYIEKDDFMFARHRTNVPFMMRGAKTIRKTSSQLMSNVDILPTLLNLCEIECDTQIDGVRLEDFGGKKRDYVLTESIFPGQTYKLAINEEEHLVSFETLEHVKSDGTIPINDYKLELKNLITSENETEKYPLKVEQYERIIFEHIKEWIYLK